MKASESLVSLPVQGAVLAARVRITITTSLVDLNRLLRQATVRRNVVVHFIRMHRDAGHPDYVGLNMREVERRAQTLASTDEPSIPNGLAASLDGERRGKGGTHGRQQGRDASGTNPFRRRTSLVILSVLDLWRW